MNDFLYEVSYKTMGMVMGMLIVLLTSYEFLTHPLLTGVVLVILFVVLRILWVRSDRRAAQVEEEARKQRVEGWARGAAAQMEKHPIRIRPRFDGGTP